MALRKFGNGSRYLKYDSLNLFPVFLTFRDVICIFTLIPVFHSFFFNSCFSLYKPKLFVIFFSFCPANLLHKTIAGSVIVIRQNNLDTDPWLWYGKIIWTRIRNMWTSIYPVQSTVLLERKKVPCIPVSINSSFECWGTSPPSLLLFGRGITSYYIIKTSQWIQTCTVNCV